MSTLLGMKKLFVVVLQLHVLEFFFVHLPSSLPYSESKYVKIRNVYDYVQFIGMEIFRTLQRDFRIYYRGEG